jgi:hypothetical protein
MVEALNEGRVCDGRTVMVTVAVPEEVPALLTSWWVEPVLG